MSLIPAVFRRNEAKTDPEAPLREVLGQYAETLDFYQERLAELELALEDQGWQRLMFEGEREFSREALKRIMALSRLMYLKNPLISRAVTLQASYVWGQGVSIKADDEATNQIIQEFLDDQANKAELTSHQARMMKETDLQVLGNIFFVFFEDVRANVKVRSIPPEEIADIISNPEDAKEPWFYKRVWKENRWNANSGTYEGGVRTAYYPDWRYQPGPGQRVQTVGQGDPVQWSSPVFHLKVGGMSDMKFGVPETYAAIDWARAYKEFLEDWSSITRALSRFAWSLTTTGGNQGIQAAKAKLNTTLGQAGASAETNPAPLAGSTFIQNPGTKMEPMRTSGATVSPEDGRRLLLMVAAATGFPESFFGDVSVGTLATAKSLDRPTELMIRDRQTLWADAHRAILQYVISKRRGPRRQLIRGGEEEEEIDVSFPSILEHDVDAEIKAIVNAATLDGKPLAGTIELEKVAELVLTALGVEDVEGVLAGMDFDALAQPPADDEPDNPQTEAFRQLRDAAIKLRERIEEGKQ